MESEDVIMKFGRIFYFEEGKTLSAFGLIFGENDLFYKIKTDQNIMLIPKNKITKIKVHKSQGGSSDSK